MGCCQNCEGEEEQYLMESTNERGYYYSINDVSIGNDDGDELRNPLQPRPSMLSVQLRFDATIQMETAEEFLSRLNGNIEKTTYLALQISAKKNKMSLEIYPSRNGLFDTSEWGLRTRRRHHREGEESHNLIESTENSDMSMNDDGNEHQKSLPHNPSMLSVQPHFDATVQMETAEKFLSRLNGNIEKTTCLALQISANRHLKVAQTQDVNLRTSPRFKVD
jgi:hypothetical protein